MISQTFLIFFNLMYFSVLYGLGSVNKDSGRCSSIAIDTLVTNKANMKYIWFVTETAEESVRSFGFCCNNFAPLPIFLNLESTVILKKWGDDLSPWGDRHLLSILKKGCVYKVALLMDISDNPRISLSLFCLCSLKRGDVVIPPSNDYCA